MALKLFQVLVLLAAVTATLQRKLVSDTDTYSLNDEGLQNLVQHLKTHALPSQDNKPYLDKQRSDLSSLLNIQTLNLYVKGDEEKKDQRSGVEQDRICTFGRCGCRGDRCEDRDEDREGTNEVQQILDELEKELDKEPLRCAERCGDNERCGCKGRGRGRSDDRDEEDQLRCRYGRCGNQRDEIDLKSTLEQYGKKYKISNDLEAIVVDISNFKGLLGQLNGNIKNVNRNQDRDVDLDYMYGDTRNSDNRDYDVDLDKVVVNFGQSKDDEDIVSQVVNDLLHKTIKQTEQDNDPIRPSELAEFFEAKKQKVIGNALNFVRNSRGNKDLSILSKDQQYQLQKLRAEVQRLGSKTNLKTMERTVADIVLGDGLKSKVLAHNKENNNVYIPKWVYSALKASRDDVRNKNLLPVTNKQKMKLKKPNLRRRTVKKNANEYGVPFQLQVQGLGQINT